MPTRQMLTSHPAHPGGLDVDRLRACVEACVACGQACTTCADAYPSEDNVADLTGCIRANLDCADMCEPTGRLLSRYAGPPTNVVRAFLDTCMAACRTCAEERGKHASMHEHCTVCAEACRQCEQAGRDLLETLA